METMDGVRLSIRPIAADDESALVDNFSQLSEKSVYRRFLAPVKRLTSSELTYLTELDHSDHEALIALTEDAEIVGVARYVRQDADPKRAEVSVTVLDAWQGRGVGTTLLHLLARGAAENGITQFSGVCLAENREMLQLFDELGPTTRHAADGGVTEVEVSLPTTATHVIRPLLPAAGRSQMERPGGR